jgi:hypothetical protein
MHGCFLTWAGKSKVLNLIANLASTVFIMKERALFSVEARLYWERCQFIETKRKHKEETKGTVRAGDSKSHQDRSSYPRILKSICDIVKL